MNPHEHNEDRTEEVVSTLLSAAGKAPVPPDEAFLERLSGETEKAFLAASTTGPKRFRRYRIMQARTLKWLIPTAAAAAIIFGVSFWPGKGVKSSGNGVAWADVVRSFQLARTVQFTFQNVDAAGNVERSRRVLFKEPNLTRIEGNGEIYIGCVRSGGKVLVLIPEKKQAVFQSIPGKGSDENLYESVLQFMDEGSEPMGTETLDGKEALVFWIPSCVTKVWVDPQTHLPIRIEKGAGPIKRSFSDHESMVRQYGMWVTTDFVFDAPLDDSLFSLTPPDDYQLAPVSAVPELASTTTVYAMMKFGYPLAQYAEDHQQQFPQDLSELKAYGIRDQDLVNPSRPEQSPGYVYLRPANMDHPEAIVMYEAYDQWDRGVYVLYLDMHARFLNDEARFLKELEQTKAWNAEASGQ